MTSIGIVGCGAIGRAVLKAVDSGRLDVPVAGVASRSETPARAFLGTLSTPVDYLDLPTLVDRADRVVEAAGGPVVPELAELAFGAGKALMVISIGALLDHPEVLGLSRSTGCALLLPSGAIAGLDGIKSACAGYVEHVTMTSRKPPAALAGAPFVVEHEVDLDGLAVETELFSGPARDAVRGFPANLNVSAAVSLAGIGPDRTMVRIIAVPGLQRNCHDVEVEGEFGRLHVHIENIPSENPKTGRLTALSIIRSIQQAVDPVRIGT